MKVLKRNEIIILESNLKDDAPLFDIKKSYTKGDIVRDSKSKYRAKENTSNNELDNLAYWEWIGTSNYWAMFDYYLNTSSVNEESIEVTFSCKDAAGIYIAGIKARYLLIEVLDNRSGEVIEKREYKLSGNKITCWSGYFFGEKDNLKTHNIFYERTTFTRNVSFRVKAYGSNIVSISSIICGKIINIAMSLYAKNSISLLDFSKVETDSFGYTQLTKGNFKRTNTFEVLVEDKDMDRVSYLLGDLRGEAVVFIISSYFENLINFGFLKNHEILLEKVGRSIVSIEIEGLI